MTRPSRTLVAGLAVLTLTAAALSACSGGGGDKPTADAATTTISFLNADPAETWAPLVTAFEKSHPGVKVQQVNIPYNQLNSTIAQRLNQGGGGIDVFVVNPPAVKDYDARGYLADISSLTPDALEAAVSESMVTSQQIDGRQVALGPWTTSTFLCYNKTALTKAGVDFPSPDVEERWTWEQVKAAAQKIKDAKAAQYPLIFDQFDTYYEMEPLGYSAGGGTGSSSDTIATPDFTNAGWQKALTYYHSLFTEGLSPRGVTNDKTNTLFATGSAGLMLCGTWTPSIVKEEGKKLDYGVAPAPYFEGGRPATATDSWSLAVSAKSKNTELATEFVRYAVIDKTGNLASVQAANITPTNKDAYAEFVKKLDAVGGDATKGMGALMEYELKNTAVHRPALAGDTIFETEMEKMLADIRNGADPMQRATTANETITSQIERMG